MRLLNYRFSFIISQMQKYRTSKSPPRNYKVNLIDEPPLKNQERTSFLNLVPKLGRSFTNAEQLQLQLSNQLCRLLKKSVGVSVVVKPDNYDQNQPQNHLKPVTFRFTMNEFLFRIWIHEPQIQFLDKIRSD